MKAVIDTLQSLRGVAKVTAVTLAVEVGTFRRFERATQLMSYTGMVPSEHSSGARRYQGAITKTGNNHLRRVLIEAACPASTARSKPRFQTPCTCIVHLIRSAMRFVSWADRKQLTEQSGNSHWVHWRFKCPTFLRQSFVDWAAETIPRSFWAGAFYAQQHARGASHQAALRALAFKWIRILFRCWQDRTL